MPEDNKRLNSGAKAFVPQSHLKASAPSWKPTPSSNAKGKGSGQSASAWGKKPSDAIRAAPPAQGVHQRDNNNRNDSKQSSGGRGDSGGNWSRGNRQKGRGGQNRNHRGGAGGGNGQPADGWQRGKSLPVELCTPNSGKTDAEKAVKRITAGDLLQIRLAFVAPPLSWGEKEPGPPEQCLWDAPTRVSEIDAMTKAPRISGDASHDGKRKKKKEVETAPPLEECKPLEVNDETRWKAKVFNKDGEEIVDDSTEVILKKALLILNKLSLTKFEKLSDDFIATGIGKSEECLNGAIGLIINKAQDEQHFSAMYAGLCLKLARTTFDFEEGHSKKGKRFKKMLLEQCQKEFEQDTDTKIQTATKDIEDEEEREYHAALVKKHYLGHMRFIGELYKGDLISIKIMLWCLSSLLDGDVASTSGKSDEEKKGDKDDGDSDVDEEKVECFAKLMTTIGSSLEQQSEAMKSVGKSNAADSLADCWRTVEIMAGKRDEKGPHVSNRMKFMLQDLLDMKVNGWASRRQEETAKTIAQIHKEAAKEEARTKRSSSSNSLQRMASSGSIRRQGSSGDFRNMSKSNSKPSVDSDGFVSVSSSGFSRSQSMGNFTRRNSSEKNRSAAKKPETRRSNSSGGAFGAFNDVTMTERKPSKKDEPSVPPLIEENQEASMQPKKEYPTAEECGTKAKNYLKEFIVGGDLDDVVLSLHEIIGAGEDGSIDRGAKVVEQSVLMVLEMKADDVLKFITVASKCLTEKKLESESIIRGLQDPLEFLSDIAIDAPLASSHLATIVAEVVKGKIITFDFLLGAPDYFKEEGNAAQFGCKVMKKIGGDFLTSESNLEVIGKLMTEDDRSSFSSPSDLLNSS